MAHSGRVNFKCGTQASYDALGDSVDDNTYYSCQDSGRVFLGRTELTSITVVDNVSAIPTESQYNGRIYGILE